MIFFINEFRVFVNSHYHDTLNPTQPRFIYPKQRHRPNHVSSLSVRKCDVKPHKILVHDVSRVVLTLQSYFYIFQCLEHIPKLAIGYFFSSDGFFSHEITLPQSQFVVVCVSPVCFQNIMPSRRIFEDCQHFHLTDQICHIFPWILPIEISTDNIFKIMPTRTYRFSNLDKMKPMGKQIQLHVCPHRCRILTDVFTCKQSVVQSLSPVSFENIIPSERFQVSDQISDIFHRIHPIETGTDDIFEIVTMCTDLFSYLNKMKLVCKQIQLHVYILDTTSLKILNDGQALQTYNVFSRLTNNR